MRPQLPEVPSNSCGTRLLACFGIVIATGIFFSVYDAVAHRDTPYAPMLGMAYPRLPERDISEARANRLDMDMASATNAAAQQDTSRPVQPSAAAKAKLNTAAAPKYQRPHVAAPRIGPDARAAFARSPEFGYAPYR